jgi:hypothetical protein
MRRRRRLDKKLAALFQVLPLLQYSVPEPLFAQSNLARARKKFCSEQIKRETTYFQGASGQQF